MSCSSSLSADRAQTPADRTFHTKACAPTPHYPRGPVFEGSHQGRYPLGRSTSPARFPDCDRPGVAALTLTQHPGQVQRANVSDCHALACDSRSTAGGWGSRRCHRQLSCPSGKHSDADKTLQGKKRQADTKCPATRPQQSRPALSAGRAARKRSSRPPEMSGSCATS
jgi:hypothetical protein